MPRKASRAAPKSVPLSVVVLAAGQGKRMQSDLPKVLQPLAGRPLLAYVIELAWSLGPAAIHVVYGHGGERVRERFADSPSQGLLSWVLQAEQRGTGHALRQAMPTIADEHQVLVLYGDVPLLRTETVRALCECAGTRGMALLTAILEDATGYGRIVRNRRGALRRIVEQSDATRAQRAIHEINTGVLVAPARLLKRWLGRLQPRNAQGEYYLTDVVAMAAEQKLPVQTLLAADRAEILGINDKLQLAEAEAEYRRRRARELMACGVTLVDPARIDLRGPITVGRDVLLDVNVVLQGPVQLADGVQVGPNCVISNSTIGLRTLLHANCVVQDAQIGSDCRIGPFARLRPGARVGPGAHVGNFVEIKNSEIGAGSKVNHLSYIGDATLGSGVNIGAGTITCNYDGVSKWHTRIDDGAFVGSGSMLVAPLTIGAGATIGAGSTLTSDAPAAKLTLARSRQQVIEQWQRPPPKTEKP